VGDEDAQFVGGSYVIIQKYLHDLNKWNTLSTEAQERIIGRKKLSDIELSDAVKPSCAHNALTSIVEDGAEVKILRDNMPFGQPSRGFWRSLAMASHSDARVAARFLSNSCRTGGDNDVVSDRA
jgi:putative iron-dependent peroxidase